MNREQTSPVFKTEDPGLPTTAAVFPKLNLTPVQYFPGGKGLPNWPMKRQPILRLSFIHDLLVRKQGFADRSVLPVNCTTVAEALKVDYRTIKRDMAFLSQTLHAPVAYDREARSFHYRETVILPFLDYLTVLQTRIQRREVA